MMKQALPQEFTEKLREIDVHAQRLQRRMVAVAAEAKLEGDHLRPLSETLERKAAQISHIRRSFGEVPDKVAAAAGKESR